MPARVLQKKRTPKPKVPPAVVRPSLEDVGAAGRAILCPVLVHLQDYVDKLPSIVARAVRSGHEELVLPPVPAWVLHGLNLGLRQAVAYDVFDAADASVAPHSVDDFWTNPPLAAFRARMGVALRWRAVGARGEMPTAEVLRRVVGADGDEAAHLATIMLYERELVSYLAMPRRKGGRGRRETVAHSLFLRELRREAEVFGEPYDVERVLSLWTVATGEPVTRAVRVRWTRYYAESTKVGHPKFEC